MVVIDAGVVVAAGTPAELTRAGAEGQIRFRSPVGLAVEGLRAALPSGSDVIEQEPGRYLVTGEVNPQLLAALTAWCADQGVFAEDLAVQRRSLEDVFLELTGQEPRDVTELSFAPAPGAAPRAQMLRAQTAMELRLLLRNGEQVALTMVVPLLLEFFFNLPLLY